MTDQNGRTDVAQTWRSWLTETERQWNSFFNGVMGTDSFGRLMGSYLEGYSMLQREAEAEVLPACGRLGLGVLAFSPLAQGMLTGKYRSPDGSPAGSRASGEQGRLLRERFFTPEHFARVERLLRVAEDLAVPLARVAIAWTLRHPEVTSAIVGATRTEQLEENVAAAELELTDEVLEQIEEALR